MNNKAFTNAIYILSIVCLCFGAKANTTINNDSLKKVWRNTEQPDSNRFKAIYTFYLNNSASKPELSVPVIDYHIQLAKEKQNYQEVIKAINEKSFISNIRGNHKEALNYLKEAISVAENHDDTLMIALLNINLGNAYRGVLDLKSSINFYLSGLELMRELNKEFEQAEVLSNIGLLYADVDMNDVSEQYLLEAKQLYEKLDLPDKMGHIWFHLGNIMDSRNNLDSALIMYKKATLLFEETNNNLKLTETYFYQAKLSFKKNQFDDANKYLQKTEEIGHGLTTPDNQLTHKTLKIQLLFDNNFERAKQLGDSVLMQLPTIDDNAIKSSAYKVLYTIFKKEKNFVEANRMLEMHLQFKDSLMDEDNDVAVVREAMRIQFESKFLKNQLAFEKQQAQLKYDFLKRTYGLIILALIILFAVIIIFKNRLAKQKQERNQLLQEIDKLKQQNQSAVALSSGFKLDRKKIEKAVNKKLNETDWNVLNILLNDPVVTNKKIAELAFLSVEGISSSLRRMYVSFDIKESKYMKISLLMEAMKISNATN